MIINASELTTSSLEAYADMMDETSLKVEKIAPLAMLIWSDTLKELDKRGRVKLMSGSYDDIGNALIQNTR